MFQIPTDKLMVVAGVVWFLAGANILNLGIGAYLHDWGWVLVALMAGTFAVFTVFHVCVFTKMVKRHTSRIYGYDEPRKSFFAFFDKKGYAMMAIMMGGGIALRMSGLVPDWFIAFFYVGIGAALMLAGIDFIVRFARASHQWPCPALPRTWKRAK